MWKPEHRRAADRHGVRYPSDLSDSEWALIEPAIPPVKHGGRRSEVNVREDLNAIFYVLSTGCQWQALPTGLPAKSTAHTWWAAARGERPRCAERDLVCALDGLPVAGVAEGFAAEKHRAFLPHAVGLGRHAGADPSRTLCRDPRARRARGEPDRRDHRQPERQGRSKRGSALDPQGHDAGKKVTGRKRHILVDTLAFC